MNMWENFSDFYEIAYMAEHTTVICKSCYRYILAIEKNCVRCVI